LININDKYKTLFLNKDKRYHVVTGGRGSGKSFSIALFLVLLTEQKDEVILFTRYTLTSAHISIIPEFLNMIELLGWENKFHITKNEVINKNTCSRILFRGIKTSSGTQTANLKSISGVTCWVLDEAEELTDEKVFSKIDLSIRTKGKQNRVIMVMNPTNYEHFIYEKWFAEGHLDNTVYIHTTYKDNKDNLNESILLEIENIKERNPKKYEHEILGGWIDRYDGVVFENWEVGEFDESVLSCFGMDFGWSPSPTTLVKVGIDYKQKIIYVQEKFNAIKQTSEDIVNVCKEFVPANDLIVCDYSDNSKINDLRANRVNAIPCDKGADSVRLGVKRMLDYKIIVTPESNNIQRELRKYIWNDKNAGIPLKNEDHTIDSIRYAFEYLNKIKK